MRATAKLFRESGHGEYAHHTGVFFAEQGHGAGANRVFNRHDVGLDFYVTQNLFVDQPFNFIDLVVSHRLIMIKVKA